MQTTYYLCENRADTKLEEKNFLKYSIINICYNNHQTNSGIYTSELTQSH